MSATLNIPAVLTISAAISVVSPWDHSGKNALNGRESGRVSASTVRSLSLSETHMSEIHKMSDAINRAPINCIRQLIEVVTMPDKTEI